MMEFPSSGSSKRAKTGVSGINVNVSCLVDGCNSDLSLCREYHRRHKVCAIHSKTAKVTIGGREQRFCQQCSRFHALAEFDDGKRSCRKRLDGHNRRRRKTQSDSLSRTSGMFFSGDQGTTILSFSSPQIHPSAVISPSAWAGPVKPEDESMLLSSHRPINLFPGQTSAVSYNKGVNQFQFQFLQGTDRIHLPEAGNSDRALSLLSSSGSTQSQTRNNMVSTQMLQPGQTQTSSLTSSLIHSPQFSGLRHFPFSLEMDNKDSELSDSNANNQNNTTLQFLGMFHNVPEGSSVVTGDQQTLSFRWK